MAHDVFISYSSTDKSTADAVCAFLEARGVGCWIAPRDVLPGEEYAAALVRAVHESRLMVLVFSSRANQSPQVLREVERAVSKSIPVIPFRIENVPPTAAMEYYISSCHWLDALTTPLDRHLDTLASTAAQLLSRTAARPAPASAPVPSAVPTHAAAVATKPSAWPRLVAAAGVLVVLAALVAYFFANRTAAPAASAAEASHPSASQPERTATPDAGRSTPLQGPTPTSTSANAVEAPRASPSVEAAPPHVSAKSAAPASEVPKSTSGATKPPECARLLERVSLGESDLLTPAERAALAQCGR